MTAPVYECLLPNWPPLPYGVAVRRDGGIVVRMGQTPEERKKAIELGELMIAERRATVKKNKDSAVVTQHVTEERRAGKLNDSELVTRRVPIGIMAGSWLGGAP